MSIQGLKKAVISIKDYVTKNPFERLLEEATNEEAAICPFNVLKQIGAACYEFEFYNMTKNHIWTNLKEKSPNLRKISKTLNLMEYLVLNSTEEMMNEFREEIYYINVLNDIKAADQHPEFLQAVKTKVKNLVELLEDVDRVKRERAANQKVSDRISGIGSTEKTNVSPPKNEKNEKGEKTEKTGSNKDTPKGQDQKGKQTSPEKEGIHDFSQFGNFNQKKNEGWSSNPNEWGDWSTTQNFNNPFDEFKQNAKTEEKKIEEKKMPEIANPFASLENLKISAPNNQEKKKELKDFKFDSGFVSAGVKNKEKASFEVFKKEGEAQKKKSNVEDLLIFEEKQQDQTQNNEKAINNNNITPKDTQNPIWATNNTWNNPNSGNIDNKPGDWSWGNQKQDVPKKPSQDFASAFSIPNQNLTNFSSNMNSSNPFENVQKQGPPQQNLPNTFSFNKAKTVDPANFDANGNLYKKYSDIQTNLIDLGGLKQDEKALKVEKGINQINNTTNLLLTKPEDWDKFFN